MTRPALIGELRGLLEIASDDELAAFAVIARRVMGGGRVQYGPLDLATDKRNFAKEAADEAADLLWYAAIQKVLAGYRQQHTSLDLVREFHKRFGQAIEDDPHVDNTDRNTLRIDLLAEELVELAEALGLKLEFTYVADGLPTDPVAALDALTDLQYVLDGAYLSLGFHRVKDAALAEVHRSNMSKLGEDGKPVLRDDGKILKPPGYSPPNLAQFISAPPSESINEFASAGGGATVNSTGGCPDCQSAYGEPHLSHCPWRVIVPGRGEQ